MKDTFYVLRDEDGFYRPQVFIVRDGEHAENDVAYWKSNNKLEANEDIVKVKMIEV